MRKDSRPYILKRFDLAFQRWYTNHFMRPQFDHLGHSPWFMKPWYVEIFGGPINLGNYANVIATTDKRVRLTVWSNLEGAGHITIGDYCLLCPGVRISAARSIVIGDNCMFANEAFVSDADWHGLYDRSQSVGNAEPVILGNNVWIGDRAMVFKGVTIGDNSIVGAGSVVLKDVPPNVCVAGNPAQVVKVLDAKQPIRTRQDWYADYYKLLDEFDQLDREKMMGNTWWGWIRTLITPKKGD